MQTTLPTQSDLAQMSSEELVDQMMLLWDELSVSDKAEIWIIIQEMLTANGQQLPAGDELENA